MVANNAVMVGFLLYKLTGVSLFYTFQLLSINLVYLWKLKVFQLIITILDHTLK